MHYKTEFIRFLLESGAMTFGVYTLKSGRKSPYMINIGKVGSGVSLSRMGDFYARAIYEKMETGIIPEDTNLLFGSAYKGIPLVTATSIAMSAAFELDLGWAFNRKEAKDHGEGGVFVGTMPGAGDRVLVVDDVMTAGTALRETIDLFKKYAPDAEVIGSVIAVDRKERGRDKTVSAVAEAEKEFGIPVFSIIDIDEIIEALKSGELVLECKSSFKAALPTADQIAAIEEYLAEYRAL